MSSDKYMTRYILLLIGIISIQGPLSAQIDTIYPTSNLCYKKSFTYRLVTSEYLDNGNNYFIASTVDTTYLIFENTGVPRVFKMKTAMDEAGKIKVPNQDSLHRIVPEIEFAPNGSIKQIRNWKVYRDLIISYYSAQVRANEITSSEFKELRDTVNHEHVVRRMVLNDVNCLFYLSGDTFRTDVEYIRLKAVRSPLSDQDYLFKGKLTAGRMPGTKNSFIIHAENRAEENEKPLLMEEAKAYLRKRTPAGEPVSEIKSVGLNSEQDYQYNLAQGRMMRVTFSDVLALDMSSRGNIRTFTLWDIVE